MSFSPLSFAPSRCCRTSSQTCPAYRIGSELDDIIRRLGFLAKYADMAARPGMGVAYLDGFAGVLADVVEDITDLRDKVADGHGSDPEQ